VKDTPFEKKQHEETGRHQGQLKRFLRGIQNDHEKAEREKRQAKAEVERLNKAVGGGTSSTTSAPPPSFKKTGGASKTPASAADRKKQIQQLVDMGIAVPDEYRADMALAGDWTVVSQRKVEELVIDESLNKGVRKRKFEGQEEEEEAGETVVRRGWGSTTKRYPGEDTDDLDTLFSMNPLKKKEEEEIVKKESEPPVEIDDTTARLVRPTEPDPGSLDDNPIKLDNAEDAEKPNLADIPNEPPAPIFKKRRQTAR
jgi:cell division septum initiation protein DivIVA